VNYDPNPAGPLLGMFALLAFGFVYVLILAGVYVLSSWLLSRVFRKAGIPSWKAWVPVYSQWVFLELGGQPGWLALLMVVPGAVIVTAVFTCIAAYNIGLALAVDRNRGARLVALGTLAFAGATRLWRQYHAAVDAAEQSRLLSSPVYQAVPFTD
jgi:hypothetical protein